MASLFSEQHRFWLAAAWLTTIIALGGSARGDVASLLILRPVAVIVVAYGIWRLDKDMARYHRFALGLAGGFIMVHLLQLLPLPPEIWHRLPGRGLIAEIDVQAGLGRRWRPLSMTPQETWNSLWALLVPVSILVLVIELSPKQRRCLLPVVVGLGLLSAVLGFIQIAGSSADSLYLYEVTNSSLQVGLFANRNHHAVFLAILLPMLLAICTTFLRDRHGRRPPALIVLGLFVAVSLLLLYAIAAAGSRSALVIALLLLATSPAGWLLRGEVPACEPSRMSRKRWWVLFVLAALPLGLLAGAMGPETAIGRLKDTDLSSEMRWLMLPGILDLIAQHGLWGSGMGSFERVFQIHESDELLRSFYANHAHNDWLELALTGGVPGMALLAIATVGVFVRAKALIQGARGQGNGFMVGWAGLLVLIAFALASATDYPLRVPSLISLAAIAWIWLDDANLRRTDQKV
jgi:O-antigen ligase